jgi:hypothetical protein
VAQGGSGVGQGGGGGGKYLKYEQIKELAIDMGFDPKVFSK